jgi:hypothetical protein
VDKKNVRQIEKRRKPVKFSPFVFLR